MTIFDVDELAVVVVLLFNVGVDVYVSNDHDVVGVDDDVSDNKDNVCADVGDAGV